MIEVLIKLMNFFFLSLYIFFIHTEDTTIVLKSDIAT